MHLVEPAAGAAVLLLMFSGAPAFAGDLRSGSIAAGDYLSSFERDYQVYVPDGVAIDGSAPLVTVLHGCAQTQADMIASTGFTDLADAQGFVVLFPFITEKAGGSTCWHFWSPWERRQGSGAVGDLRRMIDKVEGKFRTDPNRRYVTGLSSGAAMAVDLAVAYSEDIAAVGSVAGVSYADGAGAVTLGGCGTIPVTNVVARTVSAMGEEQTTDAEHRLVPLMLIQSINDCTVSVENGANLRASWIGYYGAESEPAEEADCTTENVWCRHASYIDGEGRTVVETVFYQGEAGHGTHYWPGDKTGQFANPTGPSASTSLWAFFSDKSLLPDPGPDLVVTGSEAAGGVVTLSGTIASNVALTSLSLRLDGEHPQPVQALAIAADGSWEASFAAVPEDSFYTPVFVATLADGRTVTRRADRIAVGAPLRLLDVVADEAHHAVAGRTPLLQPAGCANPGPGVCDLDIASLGLEHGFMPFELYSGDGGQTWYVDPRHASAR